MGCEQLRRYVAALEHFIDNVAPELSEAELRVCLAVLKATKGDPHNSTVLTLPDFMNAAGLSNQGVRNGIKAAVGSGHIEQVKLAQTFSYRWVSELPSEGCNEVAGTCNEVAHSSHEVAPSSETHTLLRNISSSTRASLIRDKPSSADSFNEEKFATEAERYLHRIGVPVKDKQIQPNLARWWNLHGPNQLTEYWQASLQNDAGKPASWFFADLCNGTRAFTPPRKIEEGGRYYLENRPGWYCRVLEARGKSVKVKMTSYLEKTDILTEVIPVTELGRVYGTASRAA